MIKHIIIAFVAIAALAYYFDFDVRYWIEQSDVPEWFASEEAGGSASSTEPTSTGGNP